ncbi:helix-turn-helix domain-containing protein [Rhizobium sp. 32-5/1]|uniref:helix-turn-helix domain-containing protein n=1 Tax=Rhizobium sp. 32-5/1 TaxID=3019602 RepID=UPI0032B72B15
MPLTHRSRFSTGDGIAVGKRGCRRCSLLWSPPWSSGLKEHDRLALARKMTERRLVGRLTSTKLPGPIDLVVSRPLVSAGMIARELAVTLRAALRIVEVLGLPEWRGGTSRCGA